MAVEKGILKREEIEQALGEEIKDESTVLFKAGDVVRVKDESINKTKWRRPHLRTPGYIFGLAGVVERFVALYPHPEVASYSYFDRPVPRLEGA